MLFFTLFVIEFSLVTSVLLSKVNVKRRYSDDLNTLTNEILLYMKNAQLTKAWWPTWTVTPINYTPQMLVGRVGPSSMLLPGHQPPSDIDSEVEDYKQVLDPTYQKKTRSTTTTIESTVSVTTTSTSTTTSTPRTTTSTSTTPPTSTSESPVAQELDEYIENKHVGMFSAFSIKFLKLITQKKSTEVRPLLDVCNLFITIILGDGRITRIPDKKMGDDLKKYLEMLSLFLKYSSTEDIQQRAAIFLKTVEEQNEDILKSEHFIFHFLDKYFNTKDSPAMLKAIEDMEKYPGNGKSATEVVGGLTSVVLLPFERLAGPGYMKMRVNSNITNLIDKNEAKVLTNYWDYKKDGTFGLYNTYGNYNGGNKAKSSAKHVRPVNNATNQHKDLKKSKYNNEILKLKNNYYISNNLKDAINTYRSVNVVRKVTEFNNKNVSEIIKGNARKTYKKKVSNAKKNKFNKIQLEPYKFELRRKMTYNINDIERNKRKNNLINGNTNRDDKWHHRLNYHSYESSLKNKFETKSDKNKRKLYKNYDDTIIKSDELDIQNNLFLTTHNTRRKNKNETTVQSLKNMKDKEKVTKKIKIDTMSIKEKLFDVLKGKDGRKFFTSTTRKGLGVSSESDEEIELRMNIYKAFGVNDDFNKVKDL